MGRFGASRRLGALTGALILVATLLGAGTGVTASSLGAGIELAEDHESEDPAQPDGRVQSEEEALAQDMATVAEAEGWSFAEAQRRLGPQDDFSGLTADLWKRYPDTYAGAWTDHAEDASFRYVRFLGTVPDGVRNEARSRGLNVIFKSDATFSSNELQARADTIHDDLLKTEFSEVATAVHVSAELVRVTVRRPLKYLGESDAQLRERLPASAREDYVEVRFTHLPVMTPEHSRRRLHLVGR